MAKLPSGMISKIAELVRLAASTLIGIPTAVAASVVVGTLFFAVEAANICYSHAIKNSIGLKVLKFTPALAAAADFLKGSLVKIWTGWGIYPHLQAAEAISKALNDFCSFEADGYRDRIANSKPEFAKKEEEDRKKELAAKEEDMKAKPEPTLTPEELEESRKKEAEDIERLKGSFKDMVAGMMAKHEENVKKLNPETPLEQLLEKKKEADALERDAHTGEILKSAESQLEDLLGKDDASMDAETREAMEEIKNLLNPNADPKDPSGGPLGGGARGRMPPAKL